MFKSIFFAGVFLQAHLAIATVFPTNTFSPMSSDRYDNGYTQERYEWVLDKLIEIYTPVIAEHGGSFHIQRDWSDGAVNMWAFKIGQEYWLEIPGGMSRYHLITEEGFLMSACHELGHLLGGMPYKGNGQSQISLEGQSDFFAGRECIEKVLSQIEPLKNEEASSDVKAVCGLRPNVSLCERSLIGALSITSYYAELEKVSFPKLTSPSRVVVKETLRVHPPAQCRLDTFFAGYENKQRPSCWYKN